MIIALTGAGISKPSGIDTFQDHPEVREKLTRQYATYNSEDYNRTIMRMCENIKDKKPNDAHYALFDYNIPIITMNIDNLHEQAGSKPLKLHGDLPNESEYDYAHTLFNKPVLYGDMAPNYPKAIKKISSLTQGDILLVIGASFYTQIAVTLRQVAAENNVRIIEIQENAETQVRNVLEKLKEEGSIC